MIQHRPMGCIDCDHVLLAMRLLLIDPSDRGGIPANSDLVCRALAAAGSSPELVANRAIGHGTRPYPVWRWLPAARWHLPARPGPGFYARRLAQWGASALAVEAAARLRRPGAIDFQAQLNRRFDTPLVRHLRRFAPVVWTVHDVLPFERTDADRRRFATIYRAADLVFVHNELAAERLRQLAGVAPTVIGLEAPAQSGRVDREEARRRLGLPVEGRILGALGFIRAYKGYDLLAAVWERLGSRAPTLLVMGELIDEGQWPVIERLTRADRTVVRLGYASDEALRLAFCACDSILLPYQDASESGLLDLARSLGIPVIASDAPELAAGVRDAGAGRIVPRSVDAWSEAVTGALPPASKAPPDSGFASARLAAYQEARRRWRAERTAIPGANACPAGTPPRGQDRDGMSLVAYSDALQLAGAERSLATLIAGLDPRLRVTVMGVDREVVDGIAAARPGARSVVLPPVRDKWDLAPIVAHLRAVRALRPNVFHANLRMPWACQYGVAAALLSPGTRAVVVEHLVVPAASPLQRRMKQLMTLRLAAHVAVVERLAREIELEVGVPRGMIRTIHTAVPDLPADPIRRPVEGPIVGTVARLHPEKGLDVLVRTLPKLPEVTALVVGDGPARRGLERLASELGVADRLLVAGWVSNPRPWLGAFDVFVLPSRFDQLPIALLEAMLAEVPVVATDVGSIAQVVADRQTGVLVAPDDPEALSQGVDLLLGDHALARRVARAGRRLVLERFDPQRMVAAFEDLYVEIMS